MSRGKSQLKFLAFGCIVIVLTRSILSLFSVERLVISDLIHHQYSVVLFCIRVTDIRRVISATIRQILRR